MAIITKSIKSRLTTKSPRFKRIGSSSNDHYYDRIQVTVKTLGLYTFQSDTSDMIDPYGCLYTDQFDDSMPSSNLIINDDQGRGQNQFQFSLTLENDRTYYLVVTTYLSRNIGTIPISVVGPPGITLDRVTGRDVFTKDLTSQPISIVFLISSS